MAETYKTRSGDVWDKIAKEVYGDESYASFLMGNNQDKLEFFVFPEGVELVVENLPEKKAILPDWRR